MLRIIRAFLITAFFAIMMVFLVKDHIIPEWNRGDSVEVDRAVLADAWVDQDEWFQMRFGTMPLGGIRTIADRKTQDDEYHLTANAVVNAGLFRGQLVSSALLDRKLDLQQVVMRLQLPGSGKLDDAELMNFDSESIPDGVIELAALIEFPTMYLRIRKGNSVRYEQTELARPVTMADSLQPILHPELLSPDVTYSLRVYDPFFGGKAGLIEVRQTGEETIAIDGERILADKVELRFQNMTTRLWVDSTGRTVRREIPIMGLQSGAQQAGAKNQPSLIFERMQPHDAEEKFPALRLVPREPDLTLDGMSGADQGEELGSISIFRLLSGGLQEQLGIDNE